MKGSVCGIGRNKVFYAVRTDLGYTVLELLQGQVALNDVISGNLNSHGVMTLQNDSRSTSLRAYIQAIQATKEAAESLLQSP